MCYVCCKEFKGWCKSFTRIEAFQAVLEAMFLVVLISLLVFLILHFMVCPKEPESEIPKNKALVNPNAAHKVPIHTTLPPQVECTWKPSEKTTAVTHYFISDAKTASTKSHETASIKYTENEITSHSADTESLYISDFVINNAQAGIPEDYAEVFTEDSDGEYADDMYKRYVLALVKLKPPGDLTFGCILTIITKHWTLTAASCIEAIEEVDTLDSFFIMEDYGEVKQGRSHALSDIQIHPFYQGVNKSFDLAALRSEDVLMRGSKDAVELPTIVDYFLVAIGERFIALGFGGYRRIDKSAAGRRLRQVSVFSMPSGQCGGGGEGAWAPRHLVAARGASAGACGAAPLCAGALFARGTPCAHCAGTPLLRAATLYGVMSDNRQCGVTCEPQRYVNLAVVRDWIDSILDE